MGVSKHMITMAKLLNLLLLLSAVLAATFAYSVNKYDEKRAKELLRELLSIPQTPERYMKGNLNYSKEKVSHMQSSSPSILGMQWKNCGSSSDPVRADVSLGPDPLTLPGDIKLAFNATFDMDLTSPLKADLTLKKKVIDTYIEIPCVDNIGSCSYDDVCELLSMVILPGQDCPEPLYTYKIPCNCPFKKGVYSLPSSTFPVSSIPDLPSFLTDGDYEATAKLSRNGSNLACYMLTVSINMN